MPNNPLQFDGWTFSAESPFRITNNEGVCVFEGKSFNDVMAHFTMLFQSLQNPDSTIEEKLARMEPAQIERLYWIFRYMQICGHIAPDYPKWIAEAADVLLSAGITRAGSDSYPDCIDGTSSTCGRDDCGRCRRARLARAESKVQKDAANLAKLRTRLGEMRDDAIAISKNSNSANTQNVSGGMADAYMKSLTIIDAIFGKGEA